MTYISNFSKNYYPDLREKISRSLFQDGNGTNVTRAMLNVTEMRINGVYMTYVNWSQSIVLGFVPAVMLMYFNTKIYLDIR